MSIKKLLQNSSEYVDGLLNQLLSTKKNQRFLKSFKTDQEEIKSDVFLFLCKYSETIMEINAHLLRRLIEIAKYHIIKKYNRNVNHNVSLDDLMEKQIQFIKKTPNILETVEQKENCELVQKQILNNLSKKEKTYLDNVYKLSIPTKTASKMIGYSPCFGWNIRQRILKKIKHLLKT